MQFLTSLIGGSGNTILNAVLALCVVVLLILLALWALKLVMRASNTVVRGGNRKRLAVVDTMPVDGKRQLLIVRRDNVEHLIMVGGPQDLVIENGIMTDATQNAPRPIPTVRRPQAAAAPQTVQRAPMPQRAPEPEAIMPTASNDEPTIRGPLDRLRDLGRGRTVPRTPTLRQTGLLRPVTRMEPGILPANSDNSAYGHDSGTGGRVTPLGGAQDGNGNTFDDESDDRHRDGNY